MPQSAASKARRAERRAERQQLRAKDGQESAEAEAQHKLAGSDCKIASTQVTLKRESSQHVSCFCISSSAY